MPSDKMHKRDYPSRKARKKRIINKVKHDVIKNEHTMLGVQRLDNIQYCFEDIIKNNVEGDLIETGVWRGGATIFMAALNKVYNQNRKVFVADSFEGLPEPDAKNYPPDFKDKHHTFDHLKVSQEEVAQNFNQYKLLDDNIVFIKGFFEHSLKDAPIDKLALLRLDGDMFSSTIQVLEELYDKVSPGGYIIVDDYGAVRGCRLAVSKFRKERGLGLRRLPSVPEEGINHRGYTATFWKKGF